MKILRTAGVSAFLVLGLLACKTDQPSLYENRQLGVHLIFPGPAIPGRYVEKVTPYGEMEWFGASYSINGGLGASFHVQVGNLPAGRAGGVTETAVLKSFEGWLRSRYRDLERENLPFNMGLGFRYSGTVIDIGKITGTVIVAKGRLHHAQAQGKVKDEARMKRFLDSFRVDP